MFLNFRKIASQEYSEFPGPFKKANGEEVPGLNGNRIISVETLSNFLDILANHVEF